MENRLQRSTRILVAHFIYREEFCVSCNFEVFWKGFTFVTRHEFITVKKAHSRTFTRKDKDQIFFMQRLRRK